MTIGASTNCPKSESSFCNQTISHVATTSHATIIASLYYASVLDSVNVGCFLLLQLTAPLPKENMKPLVNLLFETLPANQHPCIHVLVTGSWFHKKFHTAKYVLCTSVCTSLHPNVTFVMFA
jgi:hypothetical protein